MSRVANMECTKRPARRWVRTLWVAFVLIASIPCGLWLGSGMETLTKPSRAVDVNVEDNVFGDSLMETRLVRGPFFGYYVGLDAVAAAASLFLTVVVVTVVLKRIRHPSPEEVEQEAP